MARHGASRGTSPSLPGLVEDHVRRPAVRLKAGAEDVLERGCDRLADPFDGGGVLGALQPGGGAGYRCRPLATNEHSRGPIGSSLSRSGRSQAQNRVARGIRDRSDHTREPIARVLTCAASSSRRIKTRRPKRRKHARNGTYSDFANGLGEKPSWRGPDGKGRQQESGDVVPFAPVSPARPTRRRRSARAPDRWHRRADRARLHAAPLR